MRQMSTSVTSAMSNTSTDRKLAGYDFYHKTLHSPKYIVAPMVDHSELPWRILSRRHGAEVVYTPMINAKLFTPTNTKYRIENFNTVFGEEGGPDDRPLIVQFCANDPDQLLTAARQVEDYCDAVDINFGCPQDIARRGHYGCFLQDDWDLVYRLINILHVNLKIPVTAKFRCFPTVEKTVAYAKMMESAGAQILTCHGRLREQRGHNSGLADWEKIRAVKEAVSVPVFANGNILYQSDIQNCLERTGADGVMSAEGNLYNPAIFDYNPGMINPPIADLALEYLDIVKSLKTPTSAGAVKGHLFKIYRPALERNKDLRERLGKIHGKIDVCLPQYEELAQEMKVRMDRDILEVGETESWTPVDRGDGTFDIPHWRAQPYFRPGPIPGSKAAAKQASPKTSNTTTTSTKAVDKTNGADVLNTKSDNVGADIVVGEKRGSDAVRVDGENGRTLDGDTKRIKVAED